MNRSLLITAAALAFGSTILAQQDNSANLRRALPTTFSGVFHVATGVWDYGAQPEGITGGDVIFNQSAPTGFFNGSMGTGNTYVDEGRVPSLSSPAPLGTNNSYSVTGIELAYCTSELDVAGGGVGATIDLGFVDKFAAGCASLGVSVPQTAVYTISNAPASSSAGTLSCHTVFIDLSGAPFCLSGDGEGAFDGADGFGYTIRFVNAVSGAAGAFIAGDPDNVPDDTVFTTGGSGAGSGLDAADLYFVEADGSGASGCFFFGGYPGAPFASHYMKLYGLATGIECASCPNDDRYEPYLGGDDCSTAIPLNGEGALENLTANGPDGDLYSISIPDSTTLEATALFSNAQGDLDMRLWNDDCTIQFDSSDSSTDNEAVSFDNRSGAALTVVIEVFAWPSGSSSECADYALVVDFTVLPGCGTDDVFEDNDDCSSAAAAAAGLTTDLEVVDNDLDFYSFSLAQGDSIHATALFSHSQADVDMRLFSADCSVVLGSSGSVSDNEDVMWTNDTGVPVEVRIEVYIFPEGSASGCCNYDLDVVHTVGPGGGYCNPSSNSTGSPALMSTGGSWSMATNDLTLIAAPVPDKLFIFFSGPNQIEMPFGDGVRCIGGGVLRIAPPLLATSNTATTSVDLLFFGFSPGGVNFQCWFRDPDAAGTGFNTSNGFEVFLVP